MLEQYQIWVETQASAQSPFKKVNYTNSSQKNKQKKNPSFSSLVQFYWIFVQVLSNILEIYIFLLV